MAQHYGSSKIRSDYYLRKYVRKLTKVKESARMSSKYVDYLMAYTNEPNGSIRLLVNLLIDRSKNASCCAVLKSLITVHFLIYFGNDRFTQYLVSCNCSFKLGNFSDANSSQDSDMSAFVQWYAKYLNNKILSYQILTFDFCKVKRCQADGILSTMNSDKLLQILKVLQRQLYTLFEFDCTFLLINCKIKIAFMLIYRDLYQLFSGYIDCIIDFLEKHYDVNKIQAEDVLDLYIKTMNKIHQFNEMAESVGIIVDDPIPDLQKAISSLYDAINRCKDFQIGKISAADTPTEATVY